MMAARAERPRIPPGPPGELRPFQRATDSTRSVYSHTLLRINNETEVTSGPGSPSRRVPAGHTAGRSHTKSSVSHPSSTHVTPVSVQLNSPTPSNRNGAPGSPLDRGERRHCQSFGCILTGHLHKKHLRRLSNESTRVPAAWGSCSRSTQQLFAESTPGSLSPLPPRAARDEAPLRAEEQSEPSAVCVTPSRGDGAAPRHVPHGLHRKPHGNSGAFTLLET